MRINSIDHSFVGDLKVELTSPDNSTTVRLIEHVGRAEQRRRRPGGHGLRRRGRHDDRLGLERRAVHRQLPPAGRPARALRRQGAAGHLEAPRERPLRERHRLAARLGPDDPHRPVRPRRERARHPDPGGAARRSRAPARASFEFTASKAGTQFQCRLDGGDFSPCTSPQQFGNLPEGTHTFEVQGVRLEGERGRHPGGLHVDDRRDRARRRRSRAPRARAPSVQGSAGTASGDDGSVTVDLYSGSAASGSPVQTVVASRDGSGSFSAQFDRVGGGTYTVTRASERRRRQHRLERARQLHRRRPGQPAAGLRRALHRGVDGRRLRGQAHRAQQLRGRLPQELLAARLVEDGRAPRPAAPRTSRRAARRRRPRA